MTIFDDYKDNKGRNTVSPTLLWEYDLTHFDWQRSRKIVVQRIIERGWLLNFEYDWKQIARRLKEMTVRQEHNFFAVAVKRTETSRSGGQGYDLYETGPEEMNPYPS